MERSYIVISYEYLEYNANIYIFFSMTVKKNYHLVKSCYLLMMCIGVSKKSIIAV